MPELPDLTVYVEGLGRRLVGRELQRVRVTNPFLLRSVEPAPEELEGRELVEVRRLGKRIVFGFEGELYLVLHLMIAGRLHWRASGAPIPKGGGAAALDFPPGSVVVTEAGRRKRAALHAVRGREGVARFDAGGLEVLEASPEAFRAAMRRENHTLKRALTDPRVLSGVGNAYSDEILHRAGLSPFRRTRALGDEELETLRRAAVDTLVGWTARLREAGGGRFPEKVTAFRDGMAVHGRYGKPCPTCGAPVQRVAYAENECNYCPGCQTGGRVLADRSLSRLLKANWPHTLEELEERAGGGDPR